MADGADDAEGGMDAWVRVEATEADAREQVMALERALSLSCGSGRHVPVDSDDAGASTTPDAPHFLGA